MDGFFASSELEKTKTPLSLVPKCGACGLYKTCKSPKMKVTGRGLKRILLVGEAPGCISGDSLIETAFRDKSVYPNGIPIRDLVGKKFSVYSFDVKNQKMVIGKVRRVWKTGIKEAYRVTYEWKYADGENVRILQNSIVVTSNHPFLLKRVIKHDPFLGLKSDKDYLSIDDGLSVGHSLQPFHRSDARGGYQMVGSFSDKMVREGRLLLEEKIRRRLKAKEQCHHVDKNRKNDSYSNLELLSIEDHARLHTEEMNPMDRPGVREKHDETMKSKEYREAHSKMMKEKFKDPALYQKRLAEIETYKHKIAATVKAKFNDPKYYYKYLLGRLSFIKNIENPMEWLENKFKSKFPHEDLPIDNHKIVSIEPVGKIEVYDMEVEKHHNFAVNGIFVHNSEEDSQGRQFVGKTGQRLRRTMKELGVDIDRDCWLTNSLICRPPNNKTPDDYKIGYCRPILLKTIEDLEPDVIVLLGLTAVKSLIGYVWREDVGAMVRWAGWKIPSQKPNCWIVPTWHPSFVERSATEGALGPVVEGLWRKHLREAVSLSGKPWKAIPDYEKEIKVLVNPNDAIPIIEQMIADEDTVAFDYEANTLKPDSVQSEIICCSVSNGETTIAYPWQGNVIETMRNLLRSRCPKIASNLKFEDRWTRKHLGVPVRNWYWDTMVGAHCLDNRRAITSIKFQAFVRLGALSYDNHIHPYLRAKKGSSVNRILEEISLRDILYYCAMDSLLEYRVAFKQMEEIDYPLPGKEKS